MTISELIALLTEYRENFGDVTVWTLDDRIVQTEYEPHLRPEEADGNKILVIA